MVSDEFVTLGGLEGLREPAMANSGSKKDAMEDRSWTGHVQEMNAAREK